MLELPQEVQNLIYRFLNPISKPLIKNQNGNNLDWCNICGEHLGRNDLCIRVFVNNQHKHICFNCFNTRRYNLDDNSI